MGVVIERTEKIDRVFDAIYVHLRPRLEYYSTLIRDSLEEASQRVSTPETLTSREVQESLRKATHRDWEDNNHLHFRLRLDETDEESTSDKAVDCLSDQNEEGLVQEMYREIRSLFGTVPTRHDQLIPTRNLLRNLYRILRHSRQRPALKGLLRQAVRNNQRLFKQTWTSMLYLARTFYAAVAFVDLATRLDLGSIQFQQIPAAVAWRPSVSDNRSPVEVLASLGCPPPSKEWRDFFQSRGRVKEFIRLSSSKRKTVHGEVQLILHVESLAHSRERLPGTVHPYIGCSKKCCFFCDLFRVRHGYFQARGTHQTLFPLWGLPGILPQYSLPILRQFSGPLRDILRSVFTASSCPPPHRDLLQQSSAALSTAQAVRKEVPTYSIRPQTSRYVSLPYQLQLEVREF